MFKFESNQIVVTPESTGVILKVSNYLDNKELIDESIYESGWEQQTEMSKEELNWYLIKEEFNGEELYMWYDEEELYEFNK
jgi:hypothetical protein